MELNQSKDVRMCKLQKNMLTFILFLFSEEFLLEDVKNYTFLTHGAVPVPGVDEAAEFRSTVQAMQIMGLNTEELSGMFS